MCCWSDEWLTADPARQNEAAGALRTASDCGMLYEIADQRDWADALWGYTDAVNGIDSLEYARPARAGSPPAHVDHLATLGKPSGSSRPTRAGRAPLCTLADQRPSTSSPTTSSP